jgi:hypothetical protein
MVSDMQLNDEDVREFQEIWKRTFKEDIALGDARHCASQLIELYTQLAKPLPSERRSIVPPEPCATFSTAADPQKPKTARSSPSNPSVKR